MMCVRGVRLGDKLTGNNQLTLQSLALSTCFWFYGQVSLPFQFSF